MKGPYHDTRWICQTSLAPGGSSPDVRLFARRQKYVQVVATLLPDGRLDIDGVVHATPSEAAKAVTGQPTNGWWFFLTNKDPRRSLREVRRDYLESFADDVDDEDGDDEGDDDTDLPKSADLPKDADLPKGADLPEG